MPIYGALELADGAVLGLDDGFALGISAGALYVVVYLPALGEPSPEQIVNGLSADGEPAVFSTAELLEVSSVIDHAVTGLIAGFDYQFSAVWWDGSEYSDVVTVGFYAPQGVDVGVAQLVLTPTDAEAHQEYDVSASIVQCILVPYTAVIDKSISITTIPAGLELITHPAEIDSSGYWRPVANGRRNNWIEVP